MYRRSLNEAGEIWNNTEALPFLRRYNGKTFVIKYGGHAMVDAALSTLFASDIALLKIGRAHV